MYIPIGPSKKQLYKIIIGLLLIVYLIFIGMYKPKAEEFNWVWSGMQTNNYNGQAQDWTTSYSTLKSASNWRGKQNSSDKGSIQFYYQPNFTIPTTIKYGFLRGYFAFYNSETPVPSGVRLNNGNTRATICTIENVGDAFTTLYSDSSTSISTNGSIYSFSCYLLPGQTYSNIEIINSLSSVNWSAYIYMKMSIDYYFSDNSQVVNNIQNNTQNISDNLNDSSIDSSSANNLTNNSAFQDSNGLDNIIKAPLNFIQSLTNTSCSPINLTIPFMNADVSLPCMSSIYTKALGTQLVNTISLVINGIVLYRFCLVILNIVHNAKNPNKDELEVLDL